MNLNTLTQALPIVAAAYGRKLNVPVHVGGDQASTNGQVIRIPQIGDNPEACSLAYGYLAHEAGHIRFTDFNLPRNPNPLGHFLEGVLEDVRIETAIIRAYPGTRHTLDAVIDRLIADRSMTPVSETDTPAQLLGNGLLALARHRYRNQNALAAHAAQADRSMRSVFGPRFVHRLAGLMAQIPSLKDTAASMDLAKRMLALMEDEATSPQPQPQPQPSEPEAQDDDTESGDDTQPGSDSTKDSEQDGDDQAPQDGESGSGKGAEESGEDQEGPGTPGAGPAAEQVGSQALAQALNASSGDLPGDLFEAVAETLSAEATLSPTLLPTLETFAGNPRQGQVAIKRVRTHSASLTARLQGLVQAHNLTRVRTTRRGRALSPAHLHRAGVGDPRIFRVKDHRSAPNTALHLLIDLSGSMAGAKAQLALDAAMALALALEPISGVTSAVSAFPGISGYDERLTGILAHGQPVAARAGAFVQGARGGTPMTGALWYGAADLLARPEPRKVLLTLTDGVPNHFSSALDLVTRASAAGIECIGIGIQTDVDGLFPTAIRIQAMTDLKAELFRIAQSLLLSTHQ